MTVRALRSPINLQSTRSNHARAIRSRIALARATNGASTNPAPSKPSNTSSRGRAVLRAVPTQQTVIAERFFDEGGGMQLVIHAPFGGRINKAWGLALRKRFCRSFNFELQAAATDNGINISLGEQHSFPLADVFHFLHRETVEEHARASRPRLADFRHALALGRRPLARAAALSWAARKSRRKFSACARTIFSPLFFPKRPPARKISRAISKFPIIRWSRETMKDVAARSDGHRRPEASPCRIHPRRQIQCLAVDTPVPSQFSHEILNANPYAYLDDAPLEERRARAVEMRRALPESVLSEIGRLDPAAIAEVRAEVWPDVRDADELHDVLLDLIAFPESSDSLQRSTASGSTRAWSDYFSALVAARRAERARAAAESIG